MSSDRHRSRSGARSQSPSASRRESHAGRSEPTRPSRSRRALRWPVGLSVAIVVALVLAAAAALVLLRQSPGEAMQVLAQRSPVEMIGEAMRRLEGHPNLERLLLPPLTWLRGRFVREPAPGVPLRDLGKGIRPFGLTPQAYDAQGRPLAASPSAAEPRPVPSTRVLLSGAEIAAAVQAAQPGDVLEIAPGRYALPATLHTGRGGRADAPITLRAARPGTVTLEVRSVEGIVVSQPYWIFENLGWVGLCKADDECEHAFHIVGDARSTVVRNQRIVDFSAHLKINGHQGRFPDDGLLQFSTLVNTRPRVGEAPVTFVDLVAASGWQYLDNHVEGFVKQGSNGISYGMFMKGAGQRGRIERNLVVCTPTGVAQPGLRLGISIGGGTSGVGACRDQRCAVEFTGAIVANNVVAHCNDAGIDVNKSGSVLVLHNTLVNTQGVLVRNPPAEASVQNNLLDGGRVRHRSGTTLSADAGNGSGAAAAMMTPDALDLRWREAPEPVATPAPVPLDFCGRRRGALSEPGAGAAAACPGAWSAAAAAATEGR